MSKGFGKPGVSLPPKRKSQKSESPRRIKKYTFKYHSSDGCANLVKIQALTKDLEFSLRVIADEQIALGGHCDDSK